MIIIGLTGSIGMGKSTVAKMFERLGVPVFDADAEVRRVQGPGGRALAAIEAAFPGTTHRARPAPRQAGCPCLRQCHGAAATRIDSPPAWSARRSRRFLGAHRLKDAVVLDVPLLFEKGGYKRCHISVVVSAPYRVQRARVLARPGMTEAKLDGNSEGADAGSRKAPPRRCRHRNRARPAGDLAGSAKAGQEPQASLTFGSWPLLFSPHNH